MRIKPCVSAVCLWNWQRFLKLTKGYQGAGEAGTLIYLFGENGNSSDFPKSVATCIKMKNKHSIWHHNLLGTYPEYSENKHKWWSQHHESKNNIK